MTAKRDLDNTGSIAGSSWPYNVADTVNQLAAYSLGYVAVSGTNALTGSLEVSDGFPGPSDGAIVIVDIASTNTGAVTLNLDSTGAKAVTTSAGDALVGDELIAGSVYLLTFNSTDDHWRVATSSGGGASAGSPFTRVELFDTSGGHTWTAPYDCNALFIAVGGGGSGGRESGGSALSTGGGAGGLARKTVNGISSGEEVSITVGAGGAGQNTDGSDGNAGGSTTVSSTDFSISLNCAGGEGGNVDGTSASGGAASGGDVNYNGGGSGTASAGWNSGGGAVGLFANGSGSENATSAYSAGATAAGPKYPASFPFLNTSGVGSAGASDPDPSLDSDPFCGSGGGGKSGNAGTGAGSGGARVSPGSGDGGDGLVIVAYTEDIS